MAYFSDKTIIPASIGGGDYATVTAWYASVEDATPSGDGCIGRMRGTSDDTGSITISPSQSGWSTSCRMILTAGTGYGMNDRGSSWKGALGSGDDAIFKYRLIFTSQFIEVGNIEIGPPTGTTSNGVATNPGSTADLTIWLWNIYVHDTSNISPIYLACWTSGTITCYLANIFVYNYTGNYQRGISIITDNGGTYSAYVRHCGVDGAGGSYTGQNGIADFLDVMELRNSIAIRCYAEDLYYIHDEDYNAEDDGTSSGTHSKSSITVADNFTNVNSDDWSIKDTDADIYHTGVASAPSWFTDLVGTGDNSQGVDIRGVSYASTPSMGCMEYVEASTTAAPTTTAPTTISTTTPPTTLAPTTTIDGSVCWGHDTAVTEDNIENFTGNWAGANTEIAGSGDTERVLLYSSGYSESPTWHYGAGRIKIEVDNYSAGSGSGTLQYKNGSSQANCEADSWHNYVGSFVCAGWVKVRINA